MFSKSTFRPVQADDDDHPHSNKPNPNSTSTSTPETTHSNPSPKSTPALVTPRGNVGPGPIDLSSLRPSGFNRIEPHESPFHEDEFDLEDPHFEASRSSSRQGLYDVWSGGKGMTKGEHEDVSVGLFLKCCYGKLLSLRIETVHLL